MNRPSQHALAFVFCSTLTILGCATKEAEAPVSVPAQEDDASSPDLDAGGQGGARPPLGDLVDASDADTPHSIDMR